MTGLQPSYDLSVKVRVPFWIQLSVFLLLGVVQTSAFADTNQSGELYYENDGQNLGYFNPTEPVSPEQAAMDTFFSHYANNTKEVDLVFVLDRSNSVRNTRGTGWSSILIFVRNILGHFTVDRNNTRVAIVTFSTTATVEFNDLHPVLSENENKCTMFQRLDELQRLKPSGYTATAAALEKAYNILLNSRPRAKKAVITVTDGHSNIGPPPVRRAVDILSMVWTGSGPGSVWDTDAWGQQVEMYAFGIGNACMPELRSMASAQRNHTFLLPNFSMFEEFARSMHGGAQRENWFPAGGDRFCDDQCAGPQSHCMCGARSGQYACVCDPGYGQVGKTCEVCKIGYYKEGLSAELCRRCPENSTTPSFGATSLLQCDLLPGHRKCPRLPEISHGRRFYVSGMELDEVQYTGVSCDGATDGNSCHYECEEGYRLSGYPVLRCNRSGDWLGTVPSCHIVDCEEPSVSTGDLGGGDLTYVNSTTTFRSQIKVTCRQGSVARGETKWICNKYGMWTMPRDFRCIEVFCGIITPGVLPHGAMEPDPCTSRGRHPLGYTCTVQCHAGFTRVGPANRTCVFDPTRGTTWEPRDEVTCQDVEPPRIDCPEDLVVRVADWGDNSVIVHYNNQLPPKLMDNSGDVNFTIIDAPSDGRFYTGSTQLTYIALDAAGNNVSCARIVTIKDKDFNLLYCPDNIVVTMNSPGFFMTVPWPRPVFTGEGNSSVPYQCNRADDQAFHVGQHHIRCLPASGTSSQAICTFTVTVLRPECPVPFDDLPAPANGAMVCAEVLTFNQVKSCDVHCRDGYEVRHGETTKFMCSWDGRWNTGELTHWPDCHRVRRSYAAVTSSEVPYTYAGSCSANKETIAEAFTNSLSAKLTSPSSPCSKTVLSCDVRNVVVYCGASRKKRTPQNWTHNGKSC